MADTSWTNEQGDEALLEEKSGGRLKFVVGGLVLVAAIVFLVVNAMSGNTQLVQNS